MKQILLGCLLFAGILQAQKEMTVMTYNIRLDVASDGENSWSNRRIFFISQLQFFAPDLFGIQEGLPHQVAFIDKQLSNYSYIGHGRDGGTKGEYSAIFYNKQRFKVLENHTFWLSETPEKKSKGWDAAYERVCTYGLFKDKKTRKKFWFFNTHLDHVGVDARIKGMKLILDQIATLNTKNYPVVLSGDFNDTPESSLITMINQYMDDTKSRSEAPPFGNDGTFNGFKFHESVERRIDYIFVSKSHQIKVLKYAVLTDSKNLKYPSDHFPVYVQLKLTN